MMLSLIRRHSAIRGLTRWLMLMAAGATMLLGVVTYAGTRDRLLDPQYLLAYAWLFTGLIFMLGHDRRRCSAFDLTLPLTSRQIWLAHLAAVLSIGFLSLAVIGGITAGLLALLGRAGSPLSRPDVGLAGLLLLPAGLVLLVSLREMFWRNRGGLATAGQNRIVSLLQLIGILGLILILSRYGLWTVLLLLLPSLFLFRRVWLSLPAGIGLEEDGGSSGSRAPLSRPSDLDIDGGLPRSILLWISVVRSTAKNGPALLLGNGFIVFFGMMLGGLPMIFGGQPVLLLPFTVYILFALVAKPLQMLGMYASLPISRERLLVMLLLPGMIFLSFGYCVGKISAAILGKQTDLIGIVREDDGDRLRVPTAICELTRGELPSVTAPWHESHEAQRKTIIGGTDIYSPFSTPVGCSEEYFAWQLGRAMEAVYGVTITAEELQHRYLTTDEQGALRVREDQLAEKLAITLVDDYPELRKRSWAPWYLVLVGGAGLATLLLLPWYLGRFRALHSDSSRNRRMIVVLALLIMAHSAAYAFLSGKGAEALTGSLEIVSRTAGNTVPGASWIFLLLMAGAISVAWRWALRSFAVAELPTRRPE